MFNKVFENSFEVHQKILEVNSILGNNEYFDLKYYKSQRFLKLKEFFNENYNNCSLKLVIGSEFAFSEWSGIKKYLKNISSVEVLPMNFFHEISYNTDDKVKLLRGKLLLTTNHDIMRSNVQSLRNLISLYQSCENTIFAGWDWDNHHNLQISSIYAMCSDIYFPSQRGNEYELSRLSSRMKYISPSAYEWTNEFLANHLETIMDSERITLIAGTYNYYDRFTYRNQVISTLNTQIPDIKFIEDFKNYTNKTSLDKLSEWASFKWHWLVPTYNAISVRAFYALISGVGVILPVEFQGFEEFKGLDPRDVIWYDESDVINTSRVIALASEKFTDSGKEGILRRHNFAMYSHNLHHRVQQMCDAALGYLA